MPVFLCLFLVFYPIISKVLTWWTERWPHRVQHCESFHSSLFQWDGKTRFSFPPTKYNNSSINIWLTKTWLLPALVHLSDYYHAQRDFVDILYICCGDLFYFFCKTITLVVNFLKINRIYLALTWSKLRVIDEKTEQRWRVLFLLHSRCHSWAYEMMI